MRAVRSGVYNIHFGPARPGLFSSQTYKSLGGGECDGTRKLHLLYSRVWSTVLAYNYVVIVTCTRCRSCIDIAYKWREGLGLECCARPHVFSMIKSLPWNELLNIYVESDEGLPE